MKELMNDPSIGAYNFGEDTRIKFLVSIIIVLLLIGVSAILWLDVVKYVLKKDAEGSLNSSTGPFLLLIVKPFQKYLPIEDNKLFQDIIEKNKEGQDEDVPDKIIPSLVNLYAANRLKDIQGSINILCICLIFYGLFNSWELLLKGVNLIPIYIASTLIGLLYINKLTIKYRSKKGWLGSDTYEARQIIKFMLDKAEDNNNFKGPNGHIRIVSEVQESTEKTPLFIPGVDPSIN